MAAHSPYLASLDEAGARHLSSDYAERQSGRCFICDELIDLVLARRST